jgi:hypothetical protein
VAADNQQDFQKAYAALKAAAPAGVNVDILLETRGQEAPSVVIYEQMTQLQVQLAQVEAALSTGASSSPAALGAVASSILGQPVAAADAQSALTLKQAQLTAAIVALQKSTPVIAEAQLTPEVLSLLDKARGSRAVKDESYIRLANARVAVLSAESHIDSAYTFSGGLAGSLTGRIAVGLAVTIVFGLIAIYTLEWLSQARSTES